VTTAAIGSTNSNSYSMVAVRVTASGREGLTLCDSFVPICSNSLRMVNLMLSEGDGSNPYDWASLKIAESGL